MLKRMAWATLAAPFFAATFVVNHAIALHGGGPWAWTAALRYFWMFVILLIWSNIAQEYPGRPVAWELSKQWEASWKFWVVGGTVTFYLFYAPLAFASQHAPGWVVAATFITTVAFSPFVIRAFGNPVPKVAYALSATVTAGSFMIILENAHTLTRDQMLYGVIPPLISALAYPIGNQFVASGIHGKFRNPLHPLWLRDRTWVGENAMARVFMLTAGSLPAWIITVCVAEMFGHQVVTDAQLVGTGAIAVSAGIIATTLYLKARQHNSDPYQAAAVEATQTSHVVITLLLEIWILGQAAPGLLGWVGCALVAGGQLLYILFEPRKPSP